MAPPSPVAKLFVKLQFVTLPVFWKKTAPPPSFPALLLIKLQFVNSPLFRK